MKRSHFLASLAGGAFAVPALAADGPFRHYRCRDRTSAAGQTACRKGACRRPAACRRSPALRRRPVLKLLDEGYTGYLIRTTNDDHTGPGTSGEGVLANERDNAAVAKAFGLKKVYDLGYRNHMLDAVSPLELRLRLIFLFRLLQVDTVICYDPWGHYEENPDHYVTASAVEAACWMSGTVKDYPEHFDAGLKPHSVIEKYYFARGPEYVNRVVDIGPYVDGKIAVNLVNGAQGPAGQRGAQLRTPARPAGPPAPPPRG